MTIETSFGIKQEDMRHYSKIEELVNFISESIGTNNKNELIEMMFSHIQDEHSFDEEGGKIKLVRKGGVYIKTTSKYKESYIKTLTEKIGEYVGIVKKNRDIAVRNYIKLDKKNSRTKEKLYKKLIRGPLPKSMKKFDTDMIAIKEEVEEAFYISLDNDDVQKSYKTIISGDAHLKEELRKTHPRHKKITIFEEDALEKAKMLNNSLFHTYCKKEIYKDNNNLF